MGASDAPCDTPIMGASGVSDTTHDAPMLVFDNLVKKLELINFKH